MILLLKIAVVDDEMIFVDKLIGKITESCEKLNIEFTIDKYSNGYDLLENYKKYHLIFLDIEMPAIDGITTAKKINELKNEAEIPFIVFITSHDNLVYDALKSFPFSFIRKSDFEDEDIIFDCISKVLNKVKSSSKTIIIRADRQDIVLKIYEIIYMEKLKNYSYIHTALKTYPVKSPLTDFEKLLSKHGFIRCHEGYIVNLNDICKIYDKSILLSNNETVPMSRHKVKTVREAFMKWMIELNE